MGLIDQMLTVSTTEPFQVQAYVNDSITVISNLNEALQQGGYVYAVEQYPVVGFEYRVYYIQCNLPTAGKLNDILVKHTPCATRKGCTSIL